MKIYTRTGDDGTTGLIGGRRIFKDDPRMECIGIVDELNASLGLAAVEADRELADSIHNIQADLFVIGSHLAMPQMSADASQTPVLDSSIVGRLETQIDSAESTLPPLSFFILPGGCETAARLHVARTVCRRAERLLVAFSHNHPVNPLIITYLNRLGDWLFIHARLANLRAGIADIQWPGR